MEASQERAHLLERRVRAPSDLLSVQVGEQLPHRLRVQHATSAFEGGHRPGRREPRAGQAVQEGVQPVPVGQRGLLRRVQGRVETAEDGALAPRIDQPQPRLPLGEAAGQDHEAGTGEKRRVGSAGHVRRGSHRFSLLSLLSLRRP